MAENKVIYQGRLVRDIELQEKGGFKYAEPTIAWSEKYKDIEKKCFLRCKAWRATAELLANHFKKGQEIIIDGKLITEEWEKDGQKQSRTICEIERVHFCGSKQTNNEPKGDEYLNPDLAEELPFK